MTQIFEWQHWLLENPLYFGIYFVFIWILVSTSTSKMTGWSRLAKRYRARDKSESKTMKAVQATWGSIFMAGNIYNVGSGNSGLYLSVLFPFRIGHPPLLIPWKEITATKATRRFNPIVQLRLGKDSLRPFEVSEKVAEQIKEKSGGQFDY